MSFDEQPADPHAECRREIKRLEAELRQMSLKHTAASASCEILKTEIETITKAAQAAIAALESHVERHENDRAIDRSDAAWHQYCKPWQDLADQLRKAIGWPV